MIDEAFCPVMSLNARLRRWRSMFLWYLHMARW